MWSNANSEWVCTAERRVVTAAQVWFSEVMLFTRILVPMDLSEPSIEALRLAVSIAMRVGARLTVLYVDASTLPGDEHPPGVHRAVASEVPESVAVEIVFEQGDPSECINRIASEGDHDLVVMGTHGKTGLERVMLGSVAETVVRTCSVPVLVTHDRESQ